MSVACVAGMAGAAPVVVAPDGNDAAAGTEAAPFATLQRARDAVRGTRGTVLLRGGDYPMREPLTLGPEESGTVWASYPGERARLVGGTRLPAEAFGPVRDPAVRARLPEAARDRVVLADLRALGITEFGAIRPWGFGMGNPSPPPELFVDGRAMTLARYPNEGWLTLGKVLDRGSVWGSNVPGEPELHEKPDRGAVFEVPDSHLERWAGAEDLWLFGFWWWDWADQAVRVASVDIGAKTLTTEQPHTYGFRTGGRYYAFNLLEEIDAPGEWYLDRTAGVLYLYPPGPLAAASVELSLYDGPMIVVENAEGVRLERLTLETSRGEGIVIRGGEGCRVAGCTIRRLAQQAVSVQGGRNHVVSGCDIHDVNGGISMNGGDRRTLTPGGHEALNNHISNFSRISKTYVTAISMYGVGLRAAHNRIHNAPHMALGFGGNDHIIELNEFYDVCRETSDVGVIYTGRNWSMRGNIIRHNFIHDIVGLGDGGAQGVYLDDCFSSARIVGNVLANMRGWPFQIGGGRDNVVENNITIRTGALSLDDRGLGWARRSTAPDGDMVATLREMPYLEEPWRSRYPELVGILEDDPGCPKGNIVRRNLFYRSPEPGICAKAREFGSIENNRVTTEDPGFVDLDALDLRLRPDAPIFRDIPGFEPIPFETIGLRVDPDRPVVPPHAPVIAPGPRVFAGRLAVRIASRSPGAVVRYTLDGSEPGLEASEYRGEFVLEEGATVRARAFAGDAASEAALATYTAYRLGPENPLPLSRLPAVASDGYSEPKRDMNMAGGPISLRGRVYPEGILLHPKEAPEGGFAFAEFELDGGLSRARRFRATVAVEDTSGDRGSVAFRVEIRRDGTWSEASATGVLRGGEAPVDIDADIRGADRLRLVVTDGGDNIHSDHGAWAGARLE